MSTFICYVPMNEYGDDEFFSSYAMNAFATTVRDAQEELKHHITMLIDALRWDLAGECYVDEDGDAVEQSEEDEWDVCEIVLERVSS